MMVSGPESEDDASTDEFEAEDLEGEFQDQGSSWLLNPVESAR